MGPNDAILWERFIDKFPDYFSSVDYDWHVGAGIQPPDSILGTPYEEDAKDLTQKRIDVCGHKTNGSMECIEVRPHAGVSAIGAILCYHDLHQGDFENSPCTPTIVTDFAQPDLLDIAAKHGIKIVMLGNE